MPIPSRTHLVLIPSYNPGMALATTVAAVRRYWSPVWVVDDGSTDGSCDSLVMADDLTLHQLARNSGKGAAVAEGLRRAHQSGFTHALIVDADGQHPAQNIPAFMEASLARPDAMILGRPIFAADAPWERIQGRKISNALARLHTMGGGLGDVLFGFRVYPIVPLLQVLATSRWMRRFDFDPEAAVRLSWMGVPAINMDAPVLYRPRDEGGVSHFNYLRDNILLTWMHLRLLAGGALRTPHLLLRRLRR